MVVTCFNHSQNIQRKYLHVAVKCHTTCHGKRLNNISIALTSEFRTVDMLIFMAANQNAFRSCNTRKILPCEVHSIYTLTLSQLIIYIYIYIYIYI